jgi:hypothetical protein
MAIISCENQVPSLKPHELRLSAIKEPNFDNGQRRWWPKFLREAKKFTLLGFSLGSHAYCDWKTAMGSQAETRKP